jgi:hypothetical protein
MLKKQHVFLRRRGVWLWLGAKLRLGREVNADRPLPENISIPMFSPVRKPCRRVIGHLHPIVLPCACSV